MNFISLRFAVSTAISKFQYTISDDPTINAKNKIITGCLTYSAISKLLTIDNSMISKVDSRAEEYAKSYKNIVEGLSKKYISYKEIFTYLSDNDVNDFLKITKKQIDYVNALYENKQEIKKFSTKSYSQYMYNIMHINDKDNLYLRRVHFNVIVPIIEHYMTYNGILEKDVSVENVYNSSPGKVIKLAIRGITCGKIYHDIDTNLFGVKDYVYKLELTDDGFLLLIMN